MKIVVLLLTLILSINCLASPVTFDYTQEPLISSLKTGTSIELPDGSKTIFGDNNYFCEITCDEFLTKKDKKLWFGVIGVAAILVILKKGSECCLTCVPPNVTIPPVNNPPTTETPEPHYLFLLIAALLIIERKRLSEFIQI